MFVLVAVPVSSRQPTVQDAAAESLPAAVDALQPLRDALHKWVTEDVAAALEGVVLGPCAPRLLELAEGAIAAVDKDYQAKVGGGLAAMTPDVMAEMQALLVRRQAAVAQRDKYAAQGE